MLQGIGFLLAAANSIFDTQGINFIKKLVTLDDEAFSMLCKVLRQPGGAVAGGSVDPE